MKSLRLLLLIAASLTLVGAAQAQITVTLGIKQRFHILHEPVIATAVVTNLTGRDITLADTPQFQWFGFRITAPDDQMVAPRDLHYKLPPLSVKAGETVKRSVNLTQLYELGDVGTYRIQATIYFDGLDKFFASKPTHIEINNGQVIWRRVAGVPEGQPGAGQMRVFTLLAHQRGEVKTLYVRVESQDDGTIFCTFPAGRLLDGVPPQAEFDSGNNLHILQLIGNRAYVLTKVSANGEFGGQTNYAAPKTRPTFRRLADGTLQIIGGRKEETLAQNPNAAGPPPKLSDRPVGLPSN
jgi:hypothetical protein